MIARPAHIRIFGKVWQVEGTQAALSDYLGLCHYTRQLIQITENQTPIEERDTLLHEVLHAIIYTMKAPLKDEEHTVSALATGLLGVLQDNPHFGKYLQDIQNE